MTGFRGTGALLLLLGAASTARSQATQLGGRLVPAMELVYASDGATSPPWTIDSIARELRLGSSEHCVRIRLRTSPTQATPETRTHCVQSMSMFNWDERTGQLRPARPLEPGVSLETQQPNGGRIRFETAAMEVERIPVESRSTREPVAPAALEVLPTIVTTMDSTGKVVRRLRERFSIELATATGGVFEVPDSASTGGWRTVRRFELVAIRLPN